MTSPSEPLFIESTAGQVAAELPRRGIRAVARSACPKCGKGGFEFESGNPLDDSSFARQTMSG